MQLLEATILIIDDDPGSIAMLASVLENRYEILIATTAVQGIHLATQNDLPDLILLDINLPDKNGYQICQQLKENPRSRNIPILFVTGRQEPEDQVRGLELGAVDYIVKPVVSQILQARVSTHLNLVKRARYMEEIAVTDPLTNIANRRQFNSVLESYWSRANKLNKELSILVLDIDDFQAYNTHYGYGSGDDCLVILGQILRLCTNKEDHTVARLGGEEFAIVFKDGNRQAVDELSEKIFARLEQANLPHKMSEVSDRLTVSIGGSTVNARIEGTPFAAYHKAFTALTEAKNGGKNRYVHA